MTQQLTRYHASTPQEYYQFAPLVSRWQDDERSRFVREWLCPPSMTDPEWDVYIGVCNAFKLNPLMNPRPVWAIERRERDESGKWQRSCPPQLGIAAYRIFAARSGEYAGSGAPEWCGEDGVFRTVWMKSVRYDDKGNLVPVYPYAARVPVWRQGFRVPTWGVAHWDEFAQTHPIWGKDGKSDRNIVVGHKLNNLWEKSPAMMLAKVAEKQALTKAFPEQIAEDRVGRYFTVSEWDAGRRPALSEAEAAGAGPLYPEPDEPHEGEYREEPEIMEGDPDSPADVAPPPPPPAKAPAQQPAAKPAQPAKAAEKPTWREQANAQATQEPAPPRQTGSRGDPTEFWKLSRSLGYKNQEVAEPVFGVPTMMHWLNADPALTWGDALKLLKVFAGVEEPAEIAGEAAPPAEENDGDPGPDEQPAFAGMAAPHGDPVDGR